MKVKIIVIPIFSARDVSMLYRGEIKKARLANLAASLNLRLMLVLLGTPP